MGKVLKIQKVVENEVKKFENWSAEYDKKRKATKISRNAKSKQNMQRNEENRGNWRKMH